MVDVVTIQGVGNKEALAAYRLANIAVGLAQSATNTVLNLTANTANNIAANAASLLLANIGPTLNTAIQTQLLTANIDCGQFD